MITATVQKENRPFTSRPTLMLHGGTAFAGDAPGETDFITSTAIITIIHVTIGV